MKERGKQNRAPLDFGIIKIYKQNAYNFTNRAKGLYVKAGIGGRKIRPSFGLVKRKVADK